MGAPDRDDFAAPGLAVMAAVAGGLVGALVAAFSYVAIPAAIGVGLAVVGWSLRRASRDLSRYVLLVGLGLVAGAAAGVPLRAVRRAAEKRREQHLPSSRPPAPASEAPERNQVL